MSGADIVVLMGVDEARECVTRIRSGMEDIRLAVLDLYEREGWRALGYGSWRECVGEEFGQSQRELYRELEAARVDAALTNLSNGQITESHAHELAPLLDRPDALRDAWQDAQEAAAERGQPVTAAIVREAVRNGFRGEAATAAAEMEAATAHLSPATRAALAPEMCRQRGEFKRLIRDLAGLGGGDPDAFAAVHRGYIEDFAVADATRAASWLAEFLRAWEETP